MMSMGSIAASILLFAVGVQSTVGFGLGMVSIPLLYALGYTLNQSVFLSLCASLLCSLVAWRRMGSKLPWLTSLKASGYRLLGLPFGLGLTTLPLSVPTLKACIGLLIGLGVLTQGLKLRRPILTADHSTPPSQRLAPWAFLTSGLLTGWLGMGGPPLIFWQLTGRTSTHEMKGFFYGVNILTIPFQLCLMALSQSRQFFDLLPLLSVVLPFSWLVSELILKITHGMKILTLQWASLILLTILAARSLGAWALAVLS